MKRIFAFVLVLALLMGVACAAPGDANLGVNVNEDYNDSINTAAVVGDTLYLQGYANLYSWKLGEGDLTVHPISQLDSEDPDFYVNMDRMFGDGENLYALFTYYAREQYSLDRLELREIIIGDEGVTFGESMEISTEGLTSEYDGQVYLNTPNSITCNGDYAFFQLWNDMGYPAVYAMDMSTGEGAYIDMESLQASCLYEDGTLLVEAYSYETQSAEFLVYDPMSESLSSVCEPIQNENGYYRGLAYSQESGRLFYLDGGYVMACTDFDFENAQPVAELSMAMYSDAAGLLLPGDYYVSCNYDVTCVRSTDPNALPETTLVVGGQVYDEAVSNSYYSFGNKHGDVAVVLSNSYQQDSAIIEGMLNRDSSIDIYIMNVSRQAYDALYNRGYMAEFDNPELIAEVEKMYPGVQAAITKDGKALALPVSLYGWQMSLNYKALEEKLGIARDQVPTDWLGFVEFLSELAELLPEDGSVQLVEASWMTQRDLRDQLISNVFQCYFNETTAAGETPDYNSPQLEAAMQAIMDMDYSVFGLAETYEDLEDGNMRVIEYNPDRVVLLETSNGTTLGNFYSSWGHQPLLLTLEPGAQPVLPVDMSVAFINPFTRNYALAQEFLLEMCTNMSTGTRYNVSDELNEPLRYSWYEENLKAVQEGIDQMKAQLETADPVDVPMIEQAIADNERYLAETAENDWEIAPQDIEWYRANATNLFATRYNPLEGDPSGETWNLMAQLYEGQIGVSEFLSSVGKKAKMMALEGN